MRNFIFALVLAFALAVPASAQFGGFFQQAFNFGGHQQQQQQQGDPAGRREHKGWHEMHEGYVCPASLVCVPTPADCPCPYPEDTKCVLPDDRPRDEGEGPPFVCVRSEVGCDEVVFFSKPI